MAKRTAADFTERDCGQLAELARRVYWVPSLVQRGPRWGLVQQGARPQLFPPLGRRPLGPGPRARHGVELCVGLVRAEPRARWSGQTARGAGRRRYSVGTRAGVQAGGETAGRD